PSLATRKAMVLPCSLLLAMVFHSGGLSRFRLSLARTRVGRAGKRRRPSAWLAPKLTGRCRLLRRTRNGSGRRGDGRGTVGPPPLHIWSARRGHRVARPVAVEPYPRPSIPPTARPVAPHGRALRHPRRPRNGSVLTCVFESGR